MKKIDKNFPIYQIDDLIDLTKYNVTKIEEDYIEEHRKKIRPDQGYNVPVQSTDLIKDIIDKFTEIANKNYQKIKKIENTYIMVNNEDFCPINWHNHLTTSDLVGVYYLSVPHSMKGGNISFKTDESDLSIRPIKNSLLIFPDWLLHTTNYIEGKEFRISINIEGCYE
jgi:hypothetical protein